MLNNIKDQQEFKSLKGLTQHINSIPTAEIAAKLGLKLHKTGNSLQGDCPSGHASKGGTCFSINTKDNYWRCFSCQKGGDNISLVELALKKNFVESIKWIATQFSITHSVDFITDKQLELTEEEKEKIRLFHQRADLYEEAFIWMHEQLFSENGKEALYYLTNERKYDPEILKKSEFCCFPGVKEIREYLKEKLPYAYTDIDSLPLNGAYGDNFEVAIPYRNSKGLITGFMKRSDEPEGTKVNMKDGTTKENVRWDSTYGLSKKDLFNLDKCKGQETLLIVEGYPDATYFHALGVKNIVAVGQGILSKSHLEGLKVKRVKNVIIAFDNDEVGPKNTINAIKLLLAESDVTPFVLGPVLLAPHKDPDEYVLANGIDAFKLLLKKIIKGTIWSAGYILENGCDSDEINKKNALDEVIELTGFTKDPLDKEEIISVVSKKLKITKTVVKELFKPSQNKKNSYIVNEEEIKGKFWVSSTEGVQINMKEYIDFIVEEGFSKYYLDKDYTFVRTNCNIVREHSLAQIKDHILSSVKNIDDDEHNTRNKLYETLYENVGKYFSEGLIECIPPVEIKFKRDEKHSAYVYYKNGFVNLEKNSVAGLRSYHELESPIWEHIINPRNIDLIKVKYKKPEYEQFLWNVVGGNEQRFLSLCSAIGYMLHDYKEESNAKAIILCDQKIQSNGEPNGRTGKSLVGKALEKIKNVAKVDGKNHEFKPTFTFQMVNLGTQIIDFNDVKANFDFENLFHVITESMTVEYKNKTPFVIPFSESPKILVSTNYTIKGNSSSYNDRMFELEFTDHYTPEHKPIDEFGHDFFTGWDTDEWNRFDNFMLECLQLYLDEGLVSCAFVNLSQRKLIDQTSVQFVEFAETFIEMNREYNLSELYSEFKRYMGYGEDLFDKCPTKQNTFTPWLSVYAHYKDVKHQLRKSNGKQFVKLAA